MISLFFLVDGKMLIDNVPYSDAKQEGNIFKHHKSHKKLWDDFYKDKYTYVLKTDHSL